MPISAYSATPASNTAISGINIAENCNASGINDAIRQLMADLAAPAFGTGAASFGGTLGVTGAASFASTVAVTGVATFASTIAVTGAATFASTVGITSAVTVGGTLGVTGAATFAGALTATGTITGVNQFSESSGNGYTTSGFGVTSIFNVSGLTSTASISMVAGGGPGCILPSGGTAFTPISDERFKSSLTPFGTPLAKLATLRTGTGSYLADPDKRTRSFLYAQDVQKILPEAVFELEDGTLTLDYTALVPLLVAAVTELSAEVAALKAAA